MDLVLEDTFELCDELVRYLKENHPASAWAVVSDHLLKRLETVNAHTSDCGQGLSWSELAEWTIHALEHADREREAISLCEAEAERTSDYARLVDHLIALGRHENVERWIYQKFSATKKDSPKIAFNLQDALLLIKTHQQDWPAVNTLRVVAFANTPTVAAFTQCKVAADHLDMWNAIRHTLLEHLTSGQFPWQQSEWPLPQQDERLPHVGRQASFPNFSR